MRHKYSLTLLLMAVLCLLFSLSASASAGPLITYQSNSGHTIAYAGDTVTFSVTAEGTGLSYQWEYQYFASNTPWAVSTQPGSNTPHLSVEAIPANNNCQYRCKVTDDQGREALTSPILFIVKDRPVVLLSQSGDVSAAHGSTAVFSAFAEGTSLVYCWEYQYLGSDAPWAVSSQYGNNSPNLAVYAIPARNNCQYRCRITDYEGNEVLTRPALLTVTEKPPIFITEQPQDMAVLPGTIAPFSVAAEGTDLTYQWQYQYYGSTNPWLPSTQPGSLTSQLSVEATYSLNNCQYRCRITDANGNVAYSDIVRLTVEEAPNLFFDSHPQAVTAVDGTTAHFSVKALGSGLSYQWEYRYVGSIAPWTPTSQPGNQTDHLSVAAIPGRDTCQYRCKITDAFGKIVYSKYALLTVLAKPLVITRQPQAVTVTDGSTAAFSVAAEGSDLTYRWQYQYLGSNDPWGLTYQTGNQSPNLTVDAIPGRNNCLYRCQITDAYGNVTYTDPVLLTVT